MLPRLSKFIALLAAVQLLGGHWLALQSAAWVGMVIAYSQNDSLAGALEKTFDGDHPCSLCQAVKEGRGEEEKNEIAKTVVKLDAVICAAVPLPGPRSAEWHYLSLRQQALQRHQQPPPPPPLVA